MAKRDDPDRSRFRGVLDVIHAAAVIASVAAILLGVAYGWIVAPWAAGGIIGVILLARYLSRRGREIASAVLTLAVIALATAISAWSGDGIHDVIVVSFSAVIIIANLFAHPLLSNLFTAVAVLAPVGVALAQHLTGVPDVFGTDEGAELLMLVVVLAVIAMAMRMLMDDLRGGLERARNSESRYRGIFESIHDAYCETSPDGTILEISPSGEEMLHRSREQLLNTPFVSYWETPEEYFEALNTIRENGKLENLETTMVDSAGEKHVVLVSATRVTGAHGERIIASIRDVTSRRDLETRLGQAQRMEAVGTLAGGIAHDFNNLLTVINGHSEMGLIKLERDNTEVGGDLQAILGAGNRAAELTAKLLTFSRREFTQLRVLDLNQIIGGMDRVTQPLLGEDIAVSFDLQSDLPPITADAGQTEQVLVNLLANARDAVTHNTVPPDRRRIEVITRAWKRIPECLAARPGNSDQGYVRLSIADTGLGMDAEVQSRVFEPFFTTKERGTGLGLATVFGIVEQSGGCVRIRSQQGQGTTVEVYWAASEGSPESDRFDRGVMQTGTESILLVEDEETVRRVAATSLRSHGYRVTEAGDGRRGLEFLHDGYYDLLITDVVMPQMDGWELAQEAKASKPDLPVLFVSGYAKERLGAGDVERRFEPLLQKPYTIQNLLGTVRRILDK